MISGLLKRVLAWTTLTLAIIAAPATAQKLLTTPAEKMMTSPGGVDLRTGAYAYSETDLSIGGAAGGLALTRTMIQGMAGHSNPFATFSHNWDIMIQELRVDKDDPTKTGGSYRMLVQYGGRSRTFDLSWAGGVPITFNNITSGPIARVTSTDVCRCSPNRRPISIGRWSGKKTNWPRNWTIRLMRPLSSSATDRRKEW